MTDDEALQEIPQTGLLSAFKFLQSECSRKETMLLITTFFIPDFPKKPLQLLKK